MPAKKTEKPKKQASKPAADKAAAAKKKPAPVSKAKPVAKSTKPAAAKPAAKPASKPVAKPAAKPAVKAPAKAAPKAPAKSSAKPAKTVAKPEPKSAKVTAAEAKKPAAVTKPTAAPAPAAKGATSKPSGKADKPQAAATTSQKPVAGAKKTASATPSAPIRTAVAVKSSTSKPMKEAVSLNDEDTELSGNFSLLAGPRNVKPYQLRRDEDYMNQSQLDHFRNILQSWKKDLMQEVDRTVLHMQDEASNFPDPNDRATQESEFSLELRTRDRERKLIRKIEEALNRIEDGSYGYCVETGEEIGVKRLEARPVATLCVEAQERRERRERQYGDRDDRYR